jgi:ArsR family transcriptional regulator
MKQPKDDQSNSIYSYENIVKVFDALSHPARVKIMGILYQNKRYVSELARIMNISRPLLYMHLQKLESSLLIQGNYEISTDGKAMKYYEVLPFELKVTPAILFSISESIPIRKDEQNNQSKGERYANEKRKE